MNGHLSQAWMVLVLAGLAPLPAAAQNPLRNPPPIEVPPVEVGLNLTINSLGTDVNASPQCGALGLPCTHQKPSDMGGFGLSLTPSFNVTPHVALTAEVGLYQSEWDSWDSQIRHRRERNNVRSLLVGPTISSGFFRHGRGGLEATRVWGQLLGGLESSDATPVRRALQIGGGFDGLVHPHGLIQGGPAFTLRMAVAYRRTPGTDRNLSGFRFWFGVVIGPREAN